MSKILCCVAGSARTEGYYPISVKEKAEYLWIVKHMLEVEEKAHREKREKLVSSEKLIFPDCQ